LTAKPIKESSRRQEEPAHFLSDGVTKTQTTIITNLKIRETTLLNNKKTTTMAKKCPIT
jgi:hypothetical protein